MTTPPPTHPAIVTTAIKAPLSTLQLPTIPPGPDDLLIHNRWTASTPLDLHQNDGGLLVTHPQVLGDGIAGPIVQLGANVPAALRVSDWVFGFGWREQKEKAYQAYVTLPWYLVGKLPAGIKPQEAVTLPNNFVTAFHTLTANLGLQLPWPKPEGWRPPRAEDVVLVWGAASSAGMYMVQVLGWYGYGRVFGTASAQHHAGLKAMGASRVFDYRAAGVAEEIVRAAREVSGGRSGPAVPLIVDCIGSKEGSMGPLAKVAERGSKVAVLLPVVVRDSDPDSDALPEYSMDVQGSVPWVEGVVAEGVRTHFYLENQLFKEKLQSEIMPRMLEWGVVKPNAQRIVEGRTMLERAQEAMDLLRKRAPRGERLVWRVADGEE